MDGLELRFEGGRAVDVRATQGEEADITASWWVVGGFLVCAASTVFLPDRRAVHEHAEAQAELLNA